MPAWEAGRGVFLFILGTSLPEQASKVIQLVEAGGRKTSSLSPALPVTDCGTSGVHGFLGTVTELGDLQWPL